MNEPNVFDKLFRNKAAGHIIREISPYVHRNSNVLDIGSGFGITAKKIADELKLKMTLVDVVVKRKVNLPMVVYDGVKFPFKDKTFDHALIIFVLHHAEKPAMVLLEAKRVVKGYIIVYEDVITRNPVDRIDTFLHGLAFNKAWALNNKATFKSEKEWLEIFKELKLTVIKAEPLPLRARLFYPVFRMQFILKV